MPSFLEQLIRHRRFTSRFFAGTFFLLAFLLFGLGLAALNAGNSRNRNEPALLVDEPVKTIAPTPSGTKVSVAFAATNSSDQPIRIIGATSVCGTHICLGAENLPVEIAPRTMRELAVTVETKVVGRFATDLTLFSDSPGQARIMLTIGGEITEPQKGN